MDELTSSLKCSLNTITIFKLIFSYNGSQGRLMSVDIRSVVYGNIINILSCFYSSSGAKHM